MTKKISIIAFVAAIMGLISEIIAFGSVVSRDNIHVALNIKGFLMSFNMSFFNSRLVEYYNFDSGLTANYLNIAFYIILLIGAIFYSTSNYKETRLLRFVFSIVFISHMLYIVYAFISPIIYWKYFQMQKYWWIFWILGRILNVTWIYLSYYVISNISKTKSLGVNYDELDGQKLPLPDYASYWQRFLHLILDIFICIFIFSGFTLLLGRNILEILESKVGERGIIYISLFIFRLIYYPFFEILLGATPAKFLTETKVTDNTGNRAGAEKISLRTMARFIPFEPFSFLGGSGWHDSLTSTQVLREERTGIKGGWYFLLIPLFALLGWGGYSGHEMYKNYQYRQFGIKEHAGKINAISNSLKNITTSDLIQIEDVNNSYSSEEIYLKVEELGPDELIVSVVPVKDDYSHSIYNVEKIYKRNKNYLSKIPVKRSDLNKAFTTDYDLSESSERNSVSFLLDERKFEIKRIEKLFCPIIKNRRTGSFSGNSFSMEFFDCGWPADIVELKNIEGDIKWENELPEHIESVRDNDYPNFSLRGSNYEQGRKYKFMMVLSDSLNNRHSYIIEGVNLENTILEIK